MKIRDLTVISLSLIGCSARDDDAAPNNPTIELIEKKLAVHPCVADLDQWERTYRFAKPSGLSAYATNIDHGIVEFHLRRAGRVDIRPGRNVLRRGDREDWPDGPYVQSVDGQFDLATHALRMPRCSRRASAPRLSSL